MVKHEVSVHPEARLLAQKDQLAWKLAMVAADDVPVGDEVIEMIVNRIIDNTAVALAAINRRAVVSARDMALCRMTIPGKNGARVLGSSTARVSPEWAAWANGTAVRELDMHDTFLAADYSHPGDNIPPILAVGQALNCSGADLIRGVAAGYEIHIDLVRAISLHKHKIDHIAHLCPAQAAGIGAMLKLPPETTYQAIQQAVHVSFTTRQSRKGAISSWKAYAPAHAGKLAVEAVDRAMRGEGSPSPIYEGEDSVIASLLDGPNTSYTVSLPAPSEPKRAILDSYTKEHSAEYQSQAFIDLAFRMRDRIPDLSSIDRIVLHTSHHTHYVIGTGANDPQKMDPTASRETLDHSIMYIFAVALEDGRWHHVKSYAQSRANRKSTVELWHKIETREDPEWTLRYRSTDPEQIAFGGRAEVFLRDGTRIIDAMDVANAHPRGAKPFRRNDYVRKLRTLSEGIVEHDEVSRFLDTVQALPNLRAGELHGLNVVVPEGGLVVGKPGIVP